MKFEETLTKQLYPPWGNHYVHYRELKAHLKNIVKVHTALSAMAPNKRILIAPPQLEKRSSHVPVKTEAVLTPVPLGSPSRSLKKPLTESGLRSPTSVVVPDIDIDGLSTTQLHQLLDEQEKGFFLALDNEVMRVNSHFHTISEQLKELEVVAQQASKKVITASEQAAVLHHYEELNRLGDLLREYTELNYTAVLKILKKHDKLTQTYTLGPYMQFVHSQPFYALIDRSVPYTQTTGKAYRLRAFAKSGDHDALKLELATGAPVDAADRFGTTALMLACGNGWTRCAEELLNARADPGRADQYGVTPLLAAARHGNLACVDLLLAAGAVVNRRCENGHTALLYAAENGHASVCASLLAAGADADAMDRRKQTSLLLASSLGHDEVVRVLLNAGARVDLANEDQETPLSVAASYDQVECVRLLLLHSSTSLANMHPDADNQLPTSAMSLISACVRGNVAIVELLLDAISAYQRNFNTQRDPETSPLIAIELRDKYGCTALLRAAEYGHTECMQALLKRGADPNGMRVGRLVAGAKRIDNSLLRSENGPSSAALAAYDGDMNTPLIVASVAGMVEAVRMLYNAGADVNHQARDGSTGLMWAVDRGHGEVVQELLRAGADTSLRNKFGQTALIRTAVWNSNTWRNERSLLALLQHGADVNAQSYNGSTALTIAATRGHVACVQLLLAHKANPDIVDGDGCTALARAAMWGNVDCALLLVRAGAHVDIPDQQQHTPLMLACAGDRYEVVQVLLENGADLLRTDSAGATARDIALEMGHANVVSLLQSCARCRSRAEAEKQGKEPEKDVEDQVVAHVPIASPSTAPVPLTVPHLAAEPEHVHSAAAAAAAATAPETKESALVGFPLRPLEDCTGLRRAAQSGQVVLLTQILTRHAQRMGGVGLGFYRRTGPSSMLRRWIDLPDQFGSSALILAARHGRVRCLKMLLTAHVPADPNVQNLYGNSALMSAAKRGYRRCCELLLLHGADVSQIDEMGNNALQLAAERGHVEVVELLLSHSMGAGKGSLKNEDEEGVINIEETERTADIDCDGMKLHDELSSNGSQKASKDKEKKAKKNNAQAPTIPVPAILTPPPAAPAAPATLPVPTATLAASAPAAAPSPSPVAAASNTSSAVALPSAKTMRPLSSLLDGDEEEEAVFSFPTPSPVAAPTPIAAPAPVSVPVVVPVTTVTAPVLAIAKSAPVETLPPAATPAPAAQPIPAAPASEAPLSRSSSTSSTSSSSTVPPLQPSALTRTIISHTNKHGSTALSLAAANGHPACVRLLLLHGADPNSADTHGDTALIEAALNGHSRVVKHLLGAKADTNYIGDPLTPLTAAAVHGHRDILFALLEAGATVNGKDKHGSTALIRAAQVGDEACARVLLAAGAEVNMLGESGTTALIAACARGYAGIAEMLLQHRASVNLRGEGGTTALLHASDKGHSACVDLLLRHKALTEVGNVHGHTPLIRALYWNNNVWANQAVLSLLVDAGANVNAVAEHGNTALHIAAFRGHQHAVEQLLRAKAKVDHQNSEGATPLTRAAAWGNLETMEALIAGGADVNIRDKLGRTALIHAASLNRLDAVRLLLDNGANPELKGNNGKSALDAAMEKNFEQVIALLQAAMPSKPTLKEVEEEAGEGDEDDVRLAAASPLPVAKKADKKDKKTKEVAIASSAVDYPVKVPSPMQKPLSVEVPPPTLPSLPFQIQPITPAVSVNAKHAPTPAAPAKTVTVSPYLPAPSPVDGALNLASVLRALRANEYAEVFAREGIQVPSDLAVLEEQDWAYLVPAIGVRRRLQKWAKEHFA